MLVCSFEIRKVNSRLSICLRERAKQQKSRRYVFFARLEERTQEVGINLIASCQDEAKKMMERDDGHIS